MLEDLEAFLELLIRDDERHQSANHVSVGPCRDQDQPVLAGLPKDAIGPISIGFFRGAVLDDLQRAHRAQSARLSDERKAVVEATESLLDLPPDLDGAVAQMAALEEFDRSEGGSARHRISGVGSAQAPWF